MSKDIIKYSSKTKARKEKTFRAYFVTDEV